MGGLAPATLVQKASGSPSVPQAAKQSPAAAASARKQTPLGSSSPAKAAGGGGGAASNGSGRTTKSAARSNGGGGGNNNNTRGLHLSDGAGWDADVATVGGPVVPLTPEYMQSTYGASTIHAADDQHDDDIY